MPIENVKNITEPYIISPFTLQTMKYTVTVYIEGLSLRSGSQRSIVNNIKRDSNVIDDFNISRGFLSWTPASERPIDDCIYHAVNATPSGTGCDFILEENIYNLAHKYKHLFYYSPSGNTIDICSDDDTILNDIRLAKEALAGKYTLGYYVNICEQYEEVVQIKKLLGSCFNKNMPITNRPINGYGYSKTSTLTMSLAIARTGGCIKHDDNEIYDLIESNLDGDNITVTSYVVPSKRIITIDVKDDFHYAIAYLRLVDILDDCYELVIWGDIIDAIEILAKPLTVLETDND